MRDPVSVGENGPGAQDGDSGLQPKPIPLGELLDLVADFVRRFVDMKTDNYVVVSLWAVHTWLIDVAYATPYVHVTAPEKNSGKTTLLNVVTELVREPLAGVDFTPAALFRLIAQRKPTVLIDEVDTLFARRRDSSEATDALRRILNAGYARGRTNVVHRAARANGRWGVETFAVFGPKMLAGNGDLPETLASRAIPLRMMRTARKDLEPFEEDILKAEISELRGLLRATTAASIEDLRGARPAMPDWMGDGRQRQGWRPLLAIADRAGGEWPDLARETARRLMGGRLEESEGASVRLLRALRDAFNAKETDRLPTKQLLAHLNDEANDLEFREWNKGKGIRARDLAPRLRDFNVEPRSIRMPDRATPKGYLREDCEAGFAAYLSAVSDEPPDRPDGRSTLPEKATPPQRDDQGELCVADASGNGSDENETQPPEPHNHRGCGGVAANGAEETTDGRPERCATCGRPLEKTYPGQPICRCLSDEDVARWEAKAELEDEGPA